MSDAGKIFESFGRMIDELNGHKEEPKPTHTVSVDKQHGLMVIKFENWPEDLDKTKVQVEAMLEVIFQKIEQ